MREGRHIINRRWLRIYINGLFSKCEIDIGRLGGFEWVLHFGTKYGRVISRFNLPLKYLERRINREIKEGKYV